MIDMDMGNLQSVVQAFQRVEAHQKVEAHPRVGAQIMLTRQPADIEQAEAVILPGVGAFGDGMNSLHHNGLIEPLRRHVLDYGKPLLGICLGMQLLADEGEEHGWRPGLGLLRGQVVRLQPSEPKARVPNMGWCDVSATRPGVLFGQATPAATCYFAHSYHLCCQDAADVAATFEYGGCRMTAAIEKGHLFGVQFHPEKSQDAGLNVLAAFVEHVRHLKQISPAGVP